MLSIWVDCFFLSHVLRLNSSCLWSYTKVVVTSLKTSSAWIVIFSCCSTHSAHPPFSVLCGFSSFCSSSLFLLLAWPGKPHREECFHCICMLAFFTVSSPVFVLIVGFLSVSLSSQFLFILISWSLAPNCLLCVDLATEQPLLPYLIFDCQFVIRLRLFLDLLNCSPSRFSVTLTSDLQAVVPICLLIEDEPRRLLGFRVLGLILALTKKWPQHVWCITIPLFLNCPASCFNYPIPSLHCCCTPSLIPWSLFSLLFSFFLCFPSSCLFLFFWVGK